MQKINKKLLLVLLSCFMFVVSIGSISPCLASSYKQSPLTESSTFASDSYDFDFGGNIISKPHNSTSFVDSNGVVYDYQYDILNAFYHFSFSSDLFLSVIQDTYRGTLISGSTISNQTALNNVSPVVYIDFNTFNNSSFIVSSSRIYAKGNFALTSNREFKVTTLNNYQNSTGYASYRYGVIGDFSFSDVTHIDIISALGSGVGLPCYKRFVFITDFDNYDNNVVDDCLILDVSLYSFESDSSIYFIGDFNDIYADGYNNGLNDGLSLSTSLFYNSTLSGALIYEDSNNNEYVYNLVNEPLVNLKYGVSFRNLGSLDEIEVNGVYYYFSHAYDLSLNLSKPFIYNEFFDIYSSGSSLFTYNNIKLISTNNVTYTCSFSDELDYYGYKIEPLTTQIYNQEISLFVFDVMSADILGDIKFYSYSEVYKDSFNDGYSQGFDDGEGKGIGIGRELGYQDGFQDGIDSAQSSSDVYPTFFGFFSAVVDAPVSVLFSMFDVNLFGVNLAEVLKALISIALVIFFIRLFTGG